jgi:anti-anti-sigma regulatory factor
MGIAPTKNDPSSEITVGRIGAGIYVVELIGDHGFHNSREIGATLRTLAHRNCCLVLDLSRATSVDSSVIREIVVANDNATGIGQRFRLQVREEGTSSRSFSSRRSTRSSPSTTVGAKPWRHPDPRRALSGRFRSEAACSSEPGAPERGEGLKPRVSAPVT